MSLYNQSFHSSIFKGSNFSTLVSLENSLLHRSFAWLFEVLRLLAINYIDLPDYIPTILVHIFLVMLFILPFLHCFSFDDLNKFSLFYMFLHLKIFFFQYSLELNSIYILSLKKKILLALFPLFLPTTIPTKCFHLSFPTDYGIAG